jgi:hypothetical protein
MQRRTCEVVRQPVSSESGKKVFFRKAGMLGSVEPDVPKRADTAPAPWEAELVTATLDETLAKGYAPQYIDYMSIDIEGAEYDALLGLSLDRYEIGTFTIEHNFETKKRDAIRTLREGRSLERGRVWKVEDWYVGVETCLTRSRTRQSERSRRVRRGEPPLRPVSAHRW